MAHQQPSSRLARRIPPANRIAAFRRKLLQWYETEGRHFPWRKVSASNYERIISEVLLQRTRAETVAAFLPAFIMRYPSWRKLASARRLQLENTLKPIGLYKRRAASITSLAREIDRRHGRFPYTREEIEELPGVGQYIASAVLMFCHGKGAPLLDVNMSRVLERYFGPRKLADIRYDSYLQNLAKRLTECARPAEVNWAVLDLSALVCTRQTPDCRHCVVRNGCFYYQKAGNG